MKRLLSLLCSFTIIVGEEKEAEEKNSHDVVCSQAHNTKRNASNKSFVAISMYMRDG